MKCRIALLVTVAFATLAMTQSMTEEPNQPTKWDGTHGVAFFGTGLVRRSNPPLKPYRADGTKRGPDVDVFKDFPDATYVVIEDAAAGPDGITVLATVLGFGDKKVRHAILTYNAAGNLAKIIDTAPYYPNALSVADDGTVYALENRLDSRRNKLGRYHLLNLYAPDGRLIGQGLPSDRLKAGDMSIDADDYGRAVLTLFSDGVMLYAPRSRQVVRCTRKGEFVRAVDLAPVFNQIAKEDAMDRLEVEDIALSPDYAVVALWETGTDGRQAFQSNQPQHNASGSLEVRSGKDVEAGRSLPRGMHSPAKRRSEDGPGQI